MKKLCLLLCLLLPLCLALSCAPAEEPPIGGDPLSRDEVPPAKESPEESPADTASKADGRLPEGARPAASAPEGEIILLDGVPQNTLVKVEITTENPTVRTDYLERSIQNDSSYYLYIITGEVLQRKQDGEWIAVPLGPHPEPVYTISTLHGAIVSYGLKYHEGLVPGEYRLLWDTGYGFYTVSYFTLTE